MHDNPSPGNPGNHSESPVERGLLEERVVALQGQVEELRVRLLEKRALANLGMIAAMVAHDMNNYMQVVIGHLGMVEADEQTTQHIRHALEYTEKTAGLVSEMLVLARMDQLAQGRLNFVGFLREYQREWQQLLTDGQRLTITQRPFVVPVYVEGNRELLARLVMNLVVNSRQAGARSIQIYAGAEGPTHRCPDPATCLEGDRAILTVEDDGHGMDPETRNQMFNPFFTTKKDGSGLGMVIVRTIVSVHGGNIHVESTPAMGTKISICIPRL